MTKRNFLFLLFLVCSYSELQSQNLFPPIFDRNYIPFNLELDTSYFDKKENFIQIYKDSINNERLVKTNCQSGEINIAFFKFKLNSSASYFFDSKGALVNYTVCIDKVKINHQYSENGILKRYQFLSEDTIVGHFGFLNNSYRINFNDNGTIRSKIQFTDKKQTYFEYSPDGKIVLHSHIFSSSNLDIYFIGSYKKFDEKSQLIERGKYGVIDKNSLVKEQIKQGIWKYYSNGSLIRKEKYNKLGKLVNSKNIQ